MVRICSYNCNSFRNNSFVIDHLTKHNDIIVLQELMLLNDDVHLLDNFNSDFNCFYCVDDKSQQALLTGRPTNGVAILWRKYFDQNIEPIYDSDRVIGAVLSTETGRILLLNVYMPCDNRKLDSLISYQEHLVKIKILIDQYNAAGIVILGDFNSDPFKGRFFNYLNAFCISNNLCIADVAALDSQTFSYLSAAHDTTSWLDHLICSKNLHSLISDISVNHSLCFYDHFPIGFVLNVSLQQRVTVNNDPVELFINWTGLTESDKKQFSDNIGLEFMKGELYCFDALYCTKYGCTSELHRAQLECAIKLFKSVLLKNSNIFIKKKRNHTGSNVVPGWNDHCKLLYQKAKSKFLDWCNSGRNINDSFHVEMKESRKNFKNALKFCRRNVEKLRDNKLLHNLKDKNMREFWAIVKKYKKVPNSKPFSIDGKSDDLAILSVFDKAFRDVYTSPNSREHTDAGLKASEAIYPHSAEGVNRIGAHEVCLAVSKLKPTLGPDKIHACHLKLLPQSGFAWLANFLSACLSHIFLPDCIIFGILNPLLKNKMGDKLSSSNYRPIMSSSIFLKILELIILKKITPLVSLNSRQHGFRNNFSASTSTFTLKETISSYWSNGSKVYCGFLDISKAFDKVDYSILFDKLLKLGVPYYYLGIIKNIYNNQTVRVKFGNNLSECWKINNGVRQGGILSPFLFNVYINDLIDSISKCNIGCKLGAVSSNIIGYADDIVLLAPSVDALQYLFTTSLEELTRINLSFNCLKSKLMVFDSKSSTKNIIDVSIYLDNIKVSQVQEHKYLGYILCSNLCNGQDIKKCRNSFFGQFNSILRKFNKIDISTLLYLFKSHCSSFYGSELWFSTAGCRRELNQIKVAYHKGLKKVYKVPFWTSSHAICEEAGLLTFQHLANLRTFNFIQRILCKNNPFFNLIKRHLLYYSSQFDEVFKTFRKIYSIYNLFENDPDAVVARIMFVDRHDPRSQYIRVVNN